jgi:pyruvate,water dikinase
VRVPPGFALTTHGFRQFMRDAGIQSAVGELLTGLDHEDMDKLEEASRVIREMIESCPISIELEDLIAECYRKLSVVCCIPAVPVAVRSSATAEDLPGASFAGQQDTYLWIRGIDDVMHHVRRCISSLYTGRAIAYRMKMGFPHEQVAISVGIQKMANSFSAGVMFTIHPTNGDRSVIVIDSNFGFGESVVSGEVTPDHFVVNKVALDIMERTISTKEICYTVDLKAQKSIATEVPSSARTCSRSSTTRSPNWPGWARRSKSTMAARWTSNGPSTRTFPPAATFSYCRRGRKPSGATSSRLRCRPAARPPWITSWPI